MTPGVRPLVVGNWKMNGLTSALREIRIMRRALDDGAAGVAEVAICPPATLLALAAEVVKGGSLGIGAQNCHSEPSGAYTGDISAEMIRDAGGALVIVGHSERRAGHGETDAIVRSKAEAARRADLVAIVCVGETHAERRSGRAVEIVSNQLRGSLPPEATPAGLVIAYEPIWAIGTGIIPSAEYVARAHAAIRELLCELYGDAGGRFRILYGGSVKASNARELLGLLNVDGALVGGASLKAPDFLGIVGTYARGVDAG